MGEEALKSTTERVEVNGVAYYVTAELAEGLKAQEKARLDELSKVRQPAPAPVAQPVTPTAKPKKYGDKIWEDPDAVLDELSEDILDRAEERMTKKYDAAKAVETADKNLKDFYSQFFTENKDLNEDRRYVETIFQTNYQDWNQEAQGDFTQLKKKLANESRDIILKRVKTQHEEKENTEVVLEGGGLGILNIEAPTKKPTEEVSSISDVIRQKQAARRTK
jgi:hypothetical protein